MAQGTARTFYVCKDIDDQVANYGINTRSQKLSDAVPYINVRDARMTWSCILSARIKCSTWTDSRLMTAEEAREKPEGA